MLLLRLRAIALALRAGSRSALPRSNPTPNGEEILKLDEAKSQISNPKLQIGLCELTVQSEISKFRI